MAPKMPAFCLLPFASYRIPTSAFAGVNVAPMRIFTGYQCKSPQRVCGASSVARTKNFIQLRADGTYRVFPGRCSVSLYRHQRLGRWLRPRPYVSASVEFWYHGFATENSNARAFALNRDRCRWGRQPLPVKSLLRVLTLDASGQFSHPVV